MVRVPTYASYMNLLNTSMKTKAMVDHYSYQAVSGIKYANYGGYGMKAANIVNIEASLSVTQNFLDNNVVLNTTITTMSTVMETLEDSVNSFKSQMNNSLSALSGLVDGAPVSSEISSAIAELQSVAFAGMSLMSDALNNSIGGKYIFGAGSSSAPTQFPYKTLKEFQKYYDGNNISYPTNSEAVLASRKISALQAGNLTINQGSEANEFVLSAPNGFSSLAVVGGSETTGTIKLSSLENTMQADKPGAFNGIKAGDTLLFNDGTDQKAYAVAGVSADGKTVTFAPETPVSADETFADGGNVRVSTSFAVGTVLDFDDGSALSMPSTMQVKSINDDGSLVVSANPNNFDGSITFPVTVPATNRWSLNANSYYIGGSTTETFRISDNQSITLDINASDSVFDKLFRAFGMTAQGNIVKTDADGNVTNAAEVNKLFNDAMDILQSAITNNGKSSNGSNETLSIVIAKISANYVMLDKVNTTLEAVKGNLENSVYDIKNVDKTEAAAKLLEANNSLEASYQVLSNVLNLSLLDFL